MRFPVQGERIGAGRLLLREEGGVTWPKPKLMIAQCGLPVDVLFVNKHALVLNGKDHLFISISIGKQYSAGWRPVVPVPMYYSCSCWTERFMRSSLYCHKFDCETEAPEIGMFITGCNCNTALDPQCTYPHLKLFLSFTGCCNSLMLRSLATKVWYACWRCPYWCVRSFYLKKPA